MWGAPMIAGMRVEVRLRGRESGAGYKGVVKGDNAEGITLMRWVYSSGAGETGERAEWIFFPWSAVEQVQQLG